MNQGYPPGPPTAQPGLEGCDPAIMMGPPPHAHLLLPHGYCPTPMEVGSCKPPVSSSGSSDCWPPLAPPGPMSSEAAGEAGSPQHPPLCAGCRLRIEDKFYLSAVDVKWHSACLKCAECGVELENQLSCFERDGHIYCKADYRRYLISFT
jgi:hypothetical protein